MNKRIVRLLTLAFIVATLCVSIVGTVRARNLASRIFPCDDYELGLSHKEAWRDDDGFHGDSFYLDNTPWSRVKRIIVFYQDASVEEQIQYELDHIGEPGYNFLTPRPGMVAISVGCSGQVYEIRMGHTRVVPNPYIGQVPDWALPFTIAEPIESSTGAVQVGILSGSSLAATIEWDGVWDHPFTMTTYSQPIN